MYTATLPHALSADELAERYPPAFLTMINPLRRRRSVAPQLFYAYWRDAHVQIASRLPGIHSLWINWLDYEGGAGWPRIEGISAHLPEEDRFDGVPEPTFLSEEDLGRFGAAMAPLMDDEVNIFEESIGYRSMGLHSHTFVDRLADPAPNGDEPVLRLLVFCKRTLGLPTDEFRSFMAQRFAPALAGAEAVLKLRLHLFEPYVNEEVFLAARAVSHYKAPAKQYDGCFEIVFADALELRRLAASDAWAATLEDQRRYMREQHSFRVTRRYCMRYNGRLTLAGLRTAAVSDQIRELGALNQLDPGVTELMGGR